MGQARNAKTMAIGNHAAASFLLISMTLDLAGSIRRWMACQHCVVF
jgi:hypothetical protein